LSQVPPSTAVGQISPDGQFRWDGTQWVPLPRGAREPTPWTRPQQLAAAGFFALSALYTLITSIVFINHDSMVRVMQAQGNLPAGTNIDQVVSIALFFALAFVVVIVIVWLVAALGSYLGWRWIFWVDLVLFAFGGLGALLNLGNIARPQTQQIPVWGLVVGELFDIASAALFVWLLIGVIRYGPWAMKRLGA